MTVIPISHLSPKVERSKNTFGEPCISFPQPNISLEVLHTNPLGEPCVLGRQQEASESFDSLSPRVLTPPFRHSPRKVKGGCP